MKTPMMWGELEPTGRAKGREYSFEVVARPGGLLGWELRLLEDGKAIAGGVFPVGDDVKKSRLQDELTLAFCEAQTMGLALVGMRLQHSSARPHTPAPSTRSARVRPRRPSKASLTEIPKLSSRAKVLGRGLQKNRHIPSFDE
jgi:hypothetical protein